MGPGTLYGSIKRMLADGLVEETETRPTPRSTTSAVATTASPAWASGSGSGRAGPAGGAGPPGGLARLGQPASASLPGGVTVAVSRNERVYRACCACPPRSEKATASPWPSSSPTACATSGPARLAGDRPRPGPHRPATTNGGRHGCVESPTHIGALAVVVAGAVLVWVGLGGGASLLLVSIAVVSHHRRRRATKLVSEMVVLSSASLRVVLLTPPPGRANFTINGGSRRASPASARTARPPRCRSLGEHVLQRHHFRGRRQYAEARQRHRARRQRHLEWNWRRGLLEPIILDASATTVLTTTNAISLAGSLTFVGSNALTLSAGQGLSGASGSLIKLGTAGLTLTGANTYAGATTIGTAGSAATAAR